MASTNADKPETRYPGQQGGLGKAGSRHVDPGVTTGMGSASPLDELQAVLGHRFSNLDLLHEALTHRSREGVPSYERLEFLGDRVLGLVVADLLFDHFPDESEGALARRHAALVRQDCVADVAVLWSLPPLMRLAKGEEDLGGRSNPGLLCDVCEAVIGALFRDGGWHKARDAVVAAWDPMVHRNTAPPKDPKTALQEWAQARGLPLPDYQEIDRVGPDHKPEFRLSVTVEGHPPATGAGHSKRVAAQEAAAALLAVLERSHHDPR